MAEEEKATLDTQNADALKNILTDKFENECGLTFTQDTELVERDVIEYNSLMRVAGLEKFNGPCVVTVCNYYASEGAAKKQAASGTLLFFVEEESVENFFKALGHKAFDEDDDEFVFEQMNAFAKEIAEKLNSRLAGSFQVSDGVTRRNDIAEGVPFPYKVYKYHEIAFYMWKKKAFVADLVLAAS